MAILDAAGRTAARLAGSADEAPTGTNRKGPDHEDEEAARHRHGESLRVRSIGIRRALVVGNRRREPGADVPPELEALRDQLAKYKDPVAAVRDGYLSTLGCVHYESGAMGEIGRAHG